MTKLQAQILQGSMKRSRDETENAPHSEQFAKKSKLIPSGDDGGDALKIFRAMKGSTNTDSPQRGGFQVRGGVGFQSKDAGVMPGRRERRIRCLNCGERGHTQEKCKHTAPICFNCGESGHISTHCSQPRKQKGPQSGVERPAEPKNESKELKMAKEEKQRKARMKGKKYIKCYGCGKKGHIQEECKRPQKDRASRANQIKAIEAQKAFIEFLDEKDKLTLFIKGFPGNMQEADIKALSKDIKEVRITRFPEDKCNFAHLEFVSEAVAEKNMDILKQTYIGDQYLIVDYIGTKSSFVHPKKPRLMKYVVGADLDPKKLHVTGIEPDTTPDELKLKFPKAEEIWIRAGRDCSNKIVKPASNHALVVFRSVEDAIDGLDANTKYDIRAVFGRIFCDKLKNPLKGSQLASKKLEYIIKTYKEDTPEEADSGTGSVKDVGGDRGEENESDKEDGDEKDDEDEGIVTVPAKKAAKRVVGTKKTATKAVNSKKAAANKSAVKKFEILDDKEHDESSIADDNVEEGGDDDNEDNN